MFHARETGVDYLISIPAEERIFFLQEYIKKQGLTLDDIVRMLALLYAEVYNLRGEVAKLRG